MLIKNPKFEVSAVSPKQYPTNGLPEIVLVGKSNVGKSSFINTMIRRKALARTSSEPGKTRQINFYNMDDAFYFVDLPGYGYSKMSKQEQEKVGKFTILANGEELYSEELSLEVNLQNNHLVLKIILGIIILLFLFREYNILKRKLKRRKRRRKSYAN